MTHASRPAVVHVIGFVPKAYTAQYHRIVQILCGVTANRSQGREFMRAVWGCKGGSFPNDLLQFFLAQRLLPRPIPYPNARGGKEKAQIRTRRASRLFPFLLEAGQAEVGPCFSFFVLMCPSFLPCPLPFRSRSAPDYCWRLCTRSIGSKDLIGI